MWRRRTSSKTQPVPAETHPQAWRMTLHAVGTQDEVCSAMANVQADL